MVLVVNSSSAFRSLTDLLIAARTHPGEMSIGALGPATAQHIAVEQLKLESKVNFTYVPYPGGVPAVTALLGEHVTSALANYAEVREQVVSGKLRPLAVLERERIALLPDVPTVAELGYKDFEATVWNGIVAPAKTSKEITLRLISLFSSALKSPEIQTKLLVQGLYPVGTCGADFGTFMRNQYDEFGRIIHEANIKAE